MEQVETTHVGLAEGKLNRVAVVLTLYRLSDRFDRRRLDARVFARLCRRYLRLDAELVVVDGERRSALHGAVECLAEQRNELAVVAERDRRRVRMQSLHRVDARVVLVRMEGESVHDRLRTAGRAIRGSEIGQETGRRVRLARIGRIVASVR